MDINIYYWKKINLWARSYACGQLHPCKTFLIESPSLHFINKQFYRSQRNIKSCTKILISIKGPVRLHSLIFSVSCNQGATTHEPLNLTSTIIWYNKIGKVGKEEEMNYVLSKLSSLHMVFFFFCCSLCNFLHFRYIWYDNPEKTIETHPHCFDDKGLPLSREDTTMLTNLRVVVMVVLARDPNRLMVRKMKFWPIAPQRQ